MAALAISFLACAEVAHFQLESGALGVEIRVAAKGLVEKIDGGERFRPMIACGEIARHHAVEAVIAGILVAEQVHEAVAQVLLLVRGADAEGEDVAALAEDFRQLVITEDHVLVLLVLIVPLQFVDLFFVLRVQPLLLGQGLREFRVLPRNLADDPAAQVIGFVFVVAVMIDVDDLRFSVGIQSGDKFAIAHAVLRIEMPIEGGRPTDDLPRPHEMVFLSLRDVLGQLAGKTLGTFKPLHDAEGERAFDLIGNLDAVQSLVDDNLVIHRSADASGASRQNRFVELGK